MYQDGNHDWIGQIAGRRFRVPQGLFNANIRAQRYTYQTIENLPAAEAQYQARQLVQNARYWEPETDEGVEWLDPPC